MARTVAHDADDNPIAAWMFVVDADLVDVGEAFVDGEAVAAFEVSPAVAEAIAPGQPAHLWVVAGGDGAIPPAIYATGSVIGPVEWVDDRDDSFPIIELGLTALATPIPAAALLGHPAFTGSPLHDGHDIVSPVGIDPAQADALAEHSLAEGPLAAVLRTPEVVSIDESVTLPALEVRLPDDTLLVVEAEHHDGYTVVHGSPDLSEVDELPEQHATFIDAVEYVANVVAQAADEVPVSDRDADTPEAVALFDAEGGLYVVTKWGPAEYALLWADDAGTLDVIDTYASLKEAILLPVLDEELFGDD